MKNQDDNELPAYLMSTDRLDRSEYVKMQATTTQAN